MAKMMIQKVHIGMTDKTDRNTLTKWISNKLILEIRNEKNWLTGSGNGRCKGAEG